MPFSRCWLPFEVRVVGALRGSQNLAHEAFHYLRRTRQVAGRHGEIEANGFALEILEQYRQGLIYG
jgi:hypothetical protein